MNRSRAADIMSTPVICLDEDSSIPSAVHVLRTHAISGAPVVGADGALVGVLSEADVLMKEAGYGGLSELAYLGRPFGDGELDRQRARCVGELMTRNVVSARPEMPAREVAALMKRHEVNRVPIVDKDKPVGIVTRADILAIFDRTPTDLLKAVRDAIRADLRMDPDTLDIVVQDGVVSFAGSVEAAGSIGLLETFVGEVEGVVAVDTSRLHVGLALTGKE